MPLLACAISVASPETQKQGWLDPISKLGLI